MFIVTAYTSTGYMHATSVDCLRWSVTLESASVCTSHSGVLTATVTALQTAMLCQLPPSMVMNGLEVAQFYVDNPEAARVIP